MQETCKSMKKLLCTILAFLSLEASVNGNNYSYELALIAQFLPEDPIIIEVKRHIYVLEEHADFIWTDIESVQTLLNSSPEMLANAKVICVPSNTEKYFELKIFLENAGFQMISHYYLKYRDGSFVFINPAHILPKLHKDNLPSFDAP